MGKELFTVKNKIQRLQEKKALIDKQLEPLLMQEEELENEEIITICRKNNITIRDLMEKVKREKTGNRNLKNSAKENSDENQLDEE